MKDYTDVQQKPEDQRTRPAPDQAYVAAMKNLCPSKIAGQMVINFRNKYDAEFFKTPKTEAVLKGNTVGGRMAALRTEAEEIKQKLTSRNAKVRREAIEHSREVLGEYMGLAKAAANGVRGDAPWKSVEPFIKSAVAAPKGQMIMKTPEQVSGMMDAIASGNIETFEAHVRQAVNAGKAEAAPKVPVLQQPKYGAEGRQAAQAPQGPTA